MAKKRKTSTAKQQATSSPEGPPSSIPQARNAPSFMASTSLASASLWDNVMAAVLAGIQIFSEADKFNKIAIIFGLLFVIFALWVLASYILLPLLSLFKYPLSPVIWLLRKVYGVLYWIYSWIAWFVQGIAWLGFYIHFFRIFIGYVIDVVSTFFAAIDRGYSEHQKEQEQKTAGGEGPRTQEPDDDDEPPELVDA